MAPKSNEDFLLLHHCEDADDGEQFSSELTATSKMWRCASLPAPSANVRVLLDVETTRVWCMFDLIVPLFAFRRSYPRTRFSNTS